MPIFMTLAFILATSGSTPAAVKPTDWALLSRGLLVSFR